MATRDNIGAGLLQGLVYTTCAVQRDILRGGDYYRVNVFIDVYRVHIVICALCIVGGWECDGVT